MDSNSEDKILNYILNSNENLADLYGKIVKERYEDEPTHPDDLYWEQDKSDPEIPSLCGKLICLETSLLKLMEDKILSPQNLQDIFNAIEEQLNINSDPETLGSFEVCFFESILNFIGHGRIKKEDIKDYLGPISKKLCLQNQEFWGTNELELDDN